MFCPPNGTAVLTVLNGLRASAYAQGWAARGWNAAPHSLLGTFYLELQCSVGCVHVYSRAVLLIILLRPVGARDSDQCDHLFSVSAVRELRVGPKLRVGSCCARAVRLLALAWQN